MFPALRVFKLRPLLVALLPGPLQITAMVAKTGASFKMMSNFTEEGELWELYTGSHNGGVG